jgi:hypothetical protein
MRGFFLTLWLGIVIRPGMPQEAYQIPQTVFVGDRGRLVYPLESAGETVVLDNPSQLPQAEDLVISRIALEGTRLLIDFQAYVPGTITLPPIRIGSRTYTDLKLHITSILDSGEGLVLAGPAPPLTAPGTGIVIYGTVFALILIGLSAVFGTVWAGCHLRDLREWFRRRRIRIMGRFLRRLRSGLEKNKTGEEEALSLLSGEFRNFLSFFTEMNCRAMVPGEFLRLSPSFPGGGEFADLARRARLPRGSSEVSPPGDPGVFLCGLFRRCDTLRFSGAGVDHAAALALVDEARFFILLLDRYKKARPGELREEAV